MDKQNGVTLIELLIAMVVLSVLLALAVPAMSEFIKDNRASAQTNKLVNGIQIARSEAVKRGTGAIICVSADEATCAAGDDDWGKGWIIFSDLDQDGALTIITGDGETCAENEDCILQTSGPITGDGIFDGDGTDSISFLPTGLSNSGPTTIIITCNDCRKDPVRKICVTNMGHTYINRGADLSEAACPWDS